MKQTGELLKQAREEANLSLSEVALATKINPKILNAIENGDTSNLPAKTFLKGFIRSYALYLKMDADEVIKTFNAESGDTPAPQIDKEVIRQHNEATAAAKEDKAPKRRVNDEESFSGLRAIAVVVIVVLIGVIIGVRELIEKYQKETVVADGGEIKVSPLPQKPTEKVTEETEEKSATEEAKVEVKKEEPKKEEPKTEEIAAAATKPTDSPPPALLRAPDPKPVATAPPPPAPAPAPAPVPTPEPQVQAEAPAPAPTPVSTSVLKAAKNEIILEALDKVEVKFQVHGQTKKLSLAPSQVHTIFADAPTVLDISDGGAVNIILNGRDKGPAGDLGKPKQIKIP